MKIDVRHRFACTPERFWEMYWDPSFDALLNEGSDTQTTLLDTSDDGEVLYRKVRFTPQQTLPRPVAKLLGADKLVYEQDNHWHRSQHKVVWRVLPTVMPGKVRAEGAFSVHPAPQGCELRVAGEIVVNIRFIGGKIESAVVEQVSQAYAHIARTGARWLAQHG